VLSVSYSLISKIDITLPKPVFAQGLLKKNGISIENIQNTTQGCLALIKQTTNFAA
jgi:hypothetical protein